MRTILLSFEPEWFHYLENGKKKFEYRKHFPEDFTTAYFYVSQPEKVISGIATFGMREKLSSWLEKYSDRPDAVKARILDFSEDCNWAIPVLSFQKTNSISLYQLRKDLSRFIVPRMYYYIDGTELLDYLHANLMPNGHAIQNSFSYLEDEDIC